MIRPFPKIVSGLILIAFATFLSAAVFWRSSAGAVILGKSFAVATDFRFLVVFSVAALLVRQVNIVILAIGIAGVFTAYLIMSLQEYWAALGIRVSTFDLFLTRFIASLVMLSVVQLVFGAPKKNKEPMQ